MEMSVIALYLLICAVRMTMPGLEPRDRNRIFLMRLGFAVLGGAVTYGFLALCMHGYLDRDPFSAMRIGLIIFGLFAATGEYVTRRKLRRLNIFPAHKHIPWTY
jgi:hypothetical protein